MRPAFVMSEHDWGTMNKGLGRLRTVAVWAIGVIVNMALVVSFTESYRGLYLWAAGHKVDGIFAYSWPIMIDAFSLAGEIVLLTSAIGAWSKKTRLLGWSMSLGGLTASIVANAGHVGDHASWTDQATAAVPPIAAMASMIAAISIIKQTVSTVVNVAETLEDAPALPEGYRDPLHDEITSLNDMPSNAARVRAVIATHPKGLWITPAEANEWLKSRDQDVPMHTINSTLSKERASARPIEDAPDTPAELETTSTDSEGLADAAIAAEPKEPYSPVSQIPATQRRLVRN